MGMERCKILPWLAAFVSLAMLYALLNPPFQAPDEPAHLAGCLAVAQKGNISREDIEAEILEILPRFSFWSLVRFPAPDPVPHRFYEAPLLRMAPAQTSKAQFYYHFCGALLRISGVTHPIEALYFLRFIGILFAGTAFVLAMLSARTVFKTPALQAAAVSFFAVPQVAFMAGAVNPGTVAWVSGGLMIYGALQLILGEKRMLSLICIFAGLGLGLLSHRSALTVLPGAALAVLISLPISKTGMRPERKKYGVAFSAGLILSCFIGWVSVANVSPLLVRTLFYRLGQIMQRLTLQPVPGAGSWDWIRTFSHHLHKGIWLSLGWLKASGPSVIYSLFSIYYLSLIGILLLLMLRRNAALPNRKQLIILLAVVCGSIYGGIILFWLKKQLTQGRYLFPALSAFGILFTAGILGILPEKYMSRCALLITLTNWMTAVYVLWDVLVPYNYF